ncbi:MAG: fumarylacetoacetate hydrolase family protein [Bacillota bacterium]
MGCLDSGKLTSIAVELYEAERAAEPVTPLTERFPDFGVGEAYAAQKHLLEMKLREGARLVGRKVGLTSRPMQDLLGVNEPDYGFLLDRMVVPPGDEISCSLLIQPRVEGEIAFVLDCGLEGPGVTVAQVLRATWAVVTAIEVIDSRIRDWRIRLPDTVADNASSARVVLGGVMLPAQSVDLELAGMVLRKNGRVAATGAGAAVLGHPAAAVAWLANKLAEFGERLEAGQVVLPGALAAAVPVGPGDVVEVAVQGLGAVHVVFS